MLILVGVSIQVVINSDLIGTAEDAANRTETAYTNESNLGEVNIGDEEYNSVNEYMQSFEKVGITAADIAKVTDKTEYYGKTVNYTCGDTNAGWRIFYAGKIPGGTENNIYLIADSYIAWDNIGSTLQGLLSKYGTYELAFDDVVSNTNYTDGTGATTFTSSPAKKWLKYARSTSIDSGYGYTSTNDNMRATAMMLDTTVWTQYYNSAYADYAIGGPTLDMYAASWNQTQTTQLYYNATASNSGYYLAKDTTPTTSNYNVNLSESSITNGLYIDPMDSNKGGYWISSPSAKGNNYMLAVYYSGALNYIEYDDVAISLRPVVCLSSDVELITDSSVAGSCDFGLTK